GVAVVCHEPVFKRHAISRSNVSSLPDLPTLEVVLKRYGRRAFLDIELKVSGAETQLRRLLLRHPPKKGFVVSSFLPRVLLEMHRLDAKVPLTLICENPRQLQRWQELPINAVIAHHSLVTRRLLKDVHEAGKSLYVWTVNRKSAMVRLAEMGVDGIISDRTDVLAQTFA